jgi:hypothetical protein
VVRFRVSAACVLPLLTTVPLQAAAAAKRPVLKRSNSKLLQLMQ